MTVLREFFQGEATYYWAIYLALTVAVILGFALARWHIGVKATKLTRQIDLSVDVDTYLANLCWTHLRQYEGILAHRLGVERLIREHPERVAALLATAPTLRVVGDDWAAI